MRSSPKRDESLAVQYLHLKIRAAFGQDVAVITVPVEWIRAELERVLPDGYEFYIPLPVAPGADERAPWGISGKAGTP